MKAIPNWAKKLDWYLIQKKALKYGLDQNLVAAVIQVESAGNPFAIRFLIRLFEIILHLP